MPRYFFDVTDAGNFTRDEYGAECTGDDEARDLAVGLLHDIAKDALPDGDQHEFRVASRNEAGQVAYEASLTLDGRWWPGRG